MQLLYNFSLVRIVILDLQICLSRFCIAARVMALRRETFVMDWFKSYQPSLSFLCLLLLFASPVMTSCHSFLLHRAGVAAAKTTTDTRTQRLDPLQLVVTY